MTTIGSIPKQQVETKQKNKTTFADALPYAVAFELGCIGLRALKESNRGDTFVKTIKNCAKDYVSSGKKDLVDIANMLGKKSWDKQLNKISNKKMLTAFLVGDIIFDALIFKWVCNLFRPKDK